MSQQFMEHIFSSKNSIICDSVTLQLVQENIFEKQKYDKTEG